MPIMKRTAWGFAALLTLVAGGVFALVLVVGGVGESAIERWIGEQLKTVAGSYLKPELQFESLDYQAPLSVVLTEVRLSADDPDNPGQRVDVIDAGRITIELSELPKEGKALKIASITLEDAGVHLIDSSQGGLVGFSDFLVDETPGDAPPLSEVLQIRKIIIRNGALVYDARQPGTEPMRFDKVDTTVDIDETDKGTYNLDLALKRENVLDVSLKAAADLDTMKLGVESLQTKLDMSRTNDHYLPPQVQAFIKEYDLVGALSVDASGELDLNDVADSEAGVLLKLTDAHGSFADYRLPIERLQTRAVLSERAVVIEKIDASLLDGELSGDGRFKLDGEMPAVIKLSGNGLMLKQLHALKTASGDGSAEPPPFTGKVALQVNAEAPLVDVLNQMRGKGEARIREGRIARLPLVSDLVDYLESSGHASRGDEDPEGSDEADLVFELRGDHAFFERAVINGSWFALRGKGQLFFQNKLSMNINAGPLEKIQESIGILGRPLSAVTDGLLAYRVSGPFDEIKIRPVPLGGLLGAPGENDE